MPLDNYVKEKALSLPPLKADNLEEKAKLADYLQNDLYAELSHVSIEEPYLARTLTLQHADIPNYSHSHVTSTWLASHYRFQMDILINQFIELIKNVHVDLYNSETQRNVHGFVDFHKHFQCCYVSTQPQTSVPIPPRPDPFDQYPTNPLTPNAPLPDEILLQPHNFYKTLKEMLEKIYFELSQNKSLSPQKVKHLLTILNKQMGQCGPGVFSTVQTIYKELTNEDTIPHYLEACRDEIVNQLAAEHIAEHAIDVDWQSHVFSEFQRLAALYQFPIQKSAILEDSVFDLYVNDTAFSGRTKIDDTVKTWFKQELFNRYNVQAMTNAVTINYTLRFNELKSLDFSHPDALNRLSEVAQPFLDADIFPSDSCFEEQYDEDSERYSYRLSTQFMDDLKAHTHQLLIHENFVHALYPKVLTDISKTLRKRCNSIEPSLSDSDQEIIMQIEHAINIICHTNQVSWEEKAQACLHVLNLHIQPLSQRSFGRRMAVFFRLTNDRAGVLEMELKKLRTELLITLPFCNHNAAKNIADIHQAAFNEQEIIEEQNQRIRTLCDEALANLYESTDLKNQFSLFFISQKNESSQDFLHLDKREQESLFIQDREPVFIQDIQTHYVIQAEHAFPVLRLSLADDLVDFTEISDDHINMLYLNIAINMKRIKRIAKSNDAILMEKWVSLEGINALAQLQPRLLTQDRLPLFNLFSPDTLTPSIIDELNQYIIDEPNVDSSFERLRLIIESDIDLTTLSIIRQLSAAFFTQKGIQLLKNIPVHWLTPSLIQAFNEAYDEIGNDAIRRLLCLQRKDLIQTPLIPLLILPHSFYDNDEGICFLASLPIVDETILRHINTAFEIQRDKVIHETGNMTPRLATQSTKDTVAILCRFRDHDLPLDKIHIMMMAGAALYASDTTLHLLSQLNHTDIHAITMKMLFAYHNNTGDLTRLLLQLIKYDISLNDLMPLKKQYFSPNTLDFLIAKSVWHSPENLKKLNQLDPFMTNQNALKQLLNTDPEKITQSVINNMLKARNDEHFKFHEIFELLDAQQLKSDDVDKWYQYFDKKLAGLNPLPAFHDETLITFMKRLPMGKSTKSVPPQNATDVATGIDDASVNSFSPVLTPTLSPQERIFVEIDSLEKRIHSLNDSDVGTHKRGIISKLIYHSQAHTYRLTTKKGRSERAHFYYQRLMQEGIKIDKQLGVIDLDFRLIAKKHINYDEMLEQYRTTFSLCIAKMNSYLLLFRAELDKNSDNGKINRCNAIMTTLSEHLTSLLEKHCPSVTTDPIQSNPFRQHEHTA